MKILLTGCNGQVGWELRRMLSQLGEVVAPASSDLNLADADSIMRAVRDARPDMIINAAAYTAVDRAESEPDLAMAVNGRAPGILAEEAKRLGALLVHYSTDYVFDGEKPLPYVEADEPNPLNVYGKTKWAGEKAIQEVDGSHLILRTSWVYGLRGKNFLLTMMRLLQERDEVRVVADQYGAATWSRFIADATMQLLAIRSCFSEKELLHLAAGSYWSWYEFAVAIREHLARTQCRSLARVTAITAAEYPTPAVRPENSRLSTGKIQEIGVHVPASPYLLERAMASV